jgi:M6 family metalloprotease-like protein
MRKLALLLFVAIFVSQVSLAIPASSLMIQMPQPDGTMVSVRLVGDEYYHFNTTADGYTVMLNDLGAYVYAQRVGNKLEPTSILAHDEMERGLDEIAYLASVPKGLTDRPAVEAANQRRAPRRVDLSNFDFENFRGAIILIDFTDKKFVSDDPQAFYTNLFNTRGLTSYVDPFLNQTINCLGSVCDYFSDQSDGIFEPQFDVYGPYHGKYTKYNGTLGVYETFDATAADCDARHNSIFQNALAEADEDIDFTLYNSNGDNKVDMVFFLVAGYASSTQGNNDGYLWPHAGNLYMYSISLDGLWMDRYASSTELHGSERSPATVSVEGIGTPCHEFSHVLGLPDFYDTNYEEGGMSHDPGAWDIMASGCDRDNGRTPVGYSFFERYSLGWADYTTITRKGSYSLEPVNVSRKGYILRTDVTGEFFTIENRQKAGWDTFLPGHGMIVARVDSTSTKVWSNNTVNCDPSHNYYQLLRAGNTRTGDGDDDPFPGSTGNPMITNETFPNLKTWGGVENKFNIVNITEEDDLIKFDVVRDFTTPVLWEDFEGMPATSSTTAENVEGNFASWSFSKANVTAPGSSYAIDEHSVMMKLAGRFYMVTPVYYNIYLVGCKAYNTATRGSSKFTLECSTDGGANWVKMKTPAGKDDCEIPAKTNAMCYWKMDLKNNQGAMFRITQTRGQYTTYIDDFMIYYTGEEGGPDMFTRGDVNGDNEVNIADVNTLIDVILGGNIDAETMKRADVDEDNEVGISDINSLIDLILS